jgi:hypothetical protein
MNGKYIVFSLIIMGCIFNANCCVLKSQRVSMFKLKDAFYQPYVYRNQTKGTDVIIQLVNVQKEITFDSVIFRGIRLPVFILDKDDMITIKSILSFDNAKIAIEKKVVHKPDQLLYHYKGVKHIFELKNIRALTTKYL